MKFLYVCNVLSHIVLSHIKDKTIKGSFSLFCFLTWTRSISREKNVRFLVSMHRETKLMAGSRRHVLSWTASLKTVDFLVWSPYLYLQDGSVGAEDHRHKNYEEIKAKQSTWIASRLKPLRSTCSRQSFPSEAVTESREMHLTDHAIARRARAQKHHAIIPFLCRGYGEPFYSCSFDWLYSGLTKKYKI